MAPELSFLVVTPDGDEAEECGLNVGWSVSKATTEGDALCNSRGFLNRTPVKNSILRSCSHHDGKQR